GHFCCPPPRWRGCRFVALLFGKELFHRRREWRLGEEVAELTSEGRPGAGEEPAAAEVGVHPGPLHRPAGRGVLPLPPPEAAGADGRNQEVVAHTHRFGVWPQE